MARQVADQTAYAASYRDPVRATNPYVPTRLITGGSTTTMQEVNAAYTKLKASLGGIR